MRLDVISFTERGWQLSLKLERIFGEECGLYIKGSAQGYPDKITRVTESLEEWTGRHFEEHIPIIFVGALGIAVRSIAPFIKDKLKDIPVVCVDEAGGFSIPVLSSHYGGGLYIARRIAEALGAVLVMTTATDINGRFAVDVFAAKNDLIPANKEGIKAISSKILSGEAVNIYFDNVETEGAVPEELKVVEIWEKADIVVSNRTATRSCTLQLVPKNLHLGVGCKRGKGTDEILGAIRDILRSEGLSEAAVVDISSIDLKKDEEGLAEAAAELDAGFLTYSAAQLNALEGDFSGSDFVREVTGVDNVCERSAILSAMNSGECRLVSPKAAVDGVTVAVAESRCIIKFT
ncbi:MAG: cobalamin biosynthesis protein [Lachnospiraceae bacterium]|nr:cobalamin biosynthesis protein [Lachnospiraceae bacterium]